MAQLPFYIQYVVHFNNTHKAAGALFLSQPTVTARIKTLERELDEARFKQDLIKNERLN